MQGISISNSIHFYYIWIGILNSSPPLIKV